MTERILELAKWADLIQWDTLPSGARTPDHESVVKAKKFAEFIVEDIIKTLEFHGFEDAIPYVKWYAKNKLAVSTRRA